MAQELRNMLERNIDALEQNTEMLRRLIQKEDKQTQLVKRRKNLLSGIPYTRKDLYEFKRQDLVMLAAQLGIKNTSIPQNALIERVMHAQMDSPRQKPHRTRNNYY